MEWNEPDENLMLLYQAGEEAAFSELYRRYQRRLYGYFFHKGVSQEMAEENFQNVWIKLHQSRFRYDPQFKLSAWIFTIARSVMIDSFRKESRFQKRSPLGEQLVAGSEEQETLVQPSELPWEEISDQDKRALEWRYLEEKSFEEIGQRLGLNPVNVRQRVSRALKKLKHGFNKGNL